MRCIIARPNATQWSATLLELIRRTATDLPSDVMAALRQARLSEGGTARPCRVLDALIDNADLARRDSTPICQDTGSPVFFWRVPAGTDQITLECAAREAVAEATRLGYLRRNTIDTLSGASIDSNIAPGCPACHFGQHAVEDVEVWLLLKGGGCENMSAQYSLPDAELKAGRDLDGVRAAVLHAVWRSQGAGCSPGVLGVCIGGDRADGHLEAKRQLLRRLCDRSPDPRLAELEARLLSDANRLGIGPMGTGGRSSVIGVKAAARTRLPASYFVTIAYMCWACRRRGVQATPAGDIGEWLGT